MNGGGLFTRYSLAGWVFVVVTLASLAFSSNQGKWQSITNLITAGGGSSAAAIATAALGVVAGVSAPPAVGYVLTRAVAAVDDARRVLTEGRPAWIKQGWEKAGKRHALFYSEASQGLINWQEERSTITNASYSCVLAGSAAVLLTGFVLQTWAPGVAAVVVIFAALLIGDALFNHFQREAALEYWDANRDTRSAPPVSAGK
ncbi:MAG: hypothetical protein M3072_09310 [Candidatus Dormibacteraeota bacterium]|nr:hypothetical protein [Candidatus Dormibacteraeota bacterium]